MSPRITVLVVDDSAFARKVVRESLELDPAFEVVGIARDGLEALEKIRELSPDVVTLDLTMPNLDGIGVLQALQGRPNAPRVVVVSMADEDSALGIRALRNGAIDIVHKPSALASARLYDLGGELREKVKIAAGGRTPPSLPEIVVRPARAVPMSSARKILVVGASTGGPQAVTKLLRALPAGFPLPVAIVLHMPRGYTAALAQRLDEECALEVVEGHDGIALNPGRVVIARAGRYFRVERQGGALVGVESMDGTSDHRPSVNALFESVAALRLDAIAVVLTGMGDDGTAGAAALAAQRMPVLTEAASSCVVYGMPRSVREAGHSTGEAPIDGMVELIAAHL